jgi:hypothetical protein
VLRVVAFFAVGVCAALVLLRMIVLAVRVATGSVAHRERFLQLSCCLVLHCLQLGYIVLINRSAPALLEQPGAGHREKVCTMVEYTKSGRVITQDMARAVDRFNPAGVAGYRASTAPDAPIRATREEAIADELAYLDTPKRHTCAETAGLVRAALKKSFPGVKFSVRSHTYSGGASIDVSWTDGPTRKQVEAVTYRYAGASFDGMTDSMSYHNSELTHLDDPARDGESVRFGADFVFCERSYSPEFLNRAAAAWSTKWGYAAPEVKVSRDGSAYLDPSDLRQVDGDCYCISQRVMLEVQEEAA